MLGSQLAVSTSKQQSYVIYCSVPETSDFEIEKTAVTDLPEYQKKKSSQRDRNLSPLGDIPWNWKEQLLQNQ